MVYSSNTMGGMVGEEEDAEGFIYNIRLSSVGPGNVTCSDMIYEPENIDMAMKLHYLRVIYYFGSKAFEGLTTLVIKEPMFEWLNQYPITCGRFRRNETSGRPYIKCNDCGVRFIEANCHKTLDEWLELKNPKLEKLLFSNQSIGPELSFSPLIYIQLTKFKCGGMAVGLSWAHVLGDAFSAAEFMNSLGRIVSGSGPEPPIKLAANNTQTKPKNSDGALTKFVEDPLSIKRVGPVGDNWVNVTKCKMEAFSFNVTPQQLSQLQSKLNRNATSPNFPPFEALSAVIWQSIAKIRSEEPRVVTICKKRENQTTTNGILTNSSQVVSVVKAEFPIVEANPSELAMKLQNEGLDENKNIEEAMERGNGLSDFIVYGANLTLVNLEEVDFYEFEYKGQKPISVGYRIDGVGEKGAVLVLKGGGGGGGRNSGGRYVVAILPENEVYGLKSELKREGLIIA